MSTTPTLQLTVRAVVRNSRSGKFSDGAHVGETWYSADAEVSTPGNRWSTLRLRVQGSAPIPEGEQNLIVTSVDGKQGVGVCHVA